MASDERPLLAVENLTVSFPGASGRADAVSGIGFTLHAGECLALVGESGSGKSVTARSVVGLAGGNAHVRADRLEFAGTDLSALGDRQWRKLRGRRIGLVLQESLSALDPVRRVGAEVAETLRNHVALTRKARHERVLGALREARIPQPELRARQYPHQLSGGLLQRAVIATAMAAEPDLLIADEPTTALDAVVQAEVMDVLAARKADGTAVLLISHDLSAVARLADRIAVLRDGVIVEHGPAATILREPAHPYTKQLLAAVPSLHAKGERLSAAGVVEAAPRPRSVTRDVLEIAGVTKSFRGPDGRRLAVDDVSVRLRTGETLGVLGESGSGKTTLARLALGLIEPDRGSVRLLGEAWSGRPESARRPLRGRIQWVQQDPLAAFDPRLPVARLVGEGLRERGSRQRDQVVELLGRVGLGPEVLGRRARELSGGQRQRVAIARALAPEPDVLVCDEPVSALDVSVQAQTLDLFAAVQRDLGVALLFISHDLGVVYHMSDHVVVMRYGKVVESGTADEVFQTPQHAYTRELLAATPRLGGTFEPAEPVVLPGTPKAS